MVIQAKELSAIHAARLAKARALTEAQVEIALDIVGSRELGQELVGNIIQALATNYRTVIEANKD